MKKVFLIFGTRPEAIKMYPVYKALQNIRELETKVIITSQHQEMLKQVLELTGMKVDYDLSVMEDRQTLTKITVKVLNGLKKIFEKDRPDIVLVHGDTTTTFSSALATFYEKIPVGHVEAGLRTFDKYLPYPEEMNRVLTDAISDLHFAPTEKTRENLLKSGIFDSSIFVTGNTVVDAVKEIVRINAQRGLKLPFKQPFVVVTAHRRENWGKPMESICKAINNVSKRHSGEVHFVFSVHKNPVVRETVKRVLGSNPNISLMEPMRYDEFVYLLSKSLFILTDSGGIQEEAPSLGKPVLLLRDITERPEAVEAGVVKIVGTDQARIEEYTEALLSDKYLYSSMAGAKNPFGDGNAGERIAHIVKEYLLKGE